MNSEQTTAIDMKMMSPMEQVRQIKHFAVECGSWCYVSAFDSLDELSMAAHMYLQHNKVWNGTGWIAERRQGRR